MAEEFGQCRSKANERQFCDTCAKLGKPVFLFCNQRCCVDRVAVHMSAHSSVRKASQIFEGDSEPNTSRARTRAQSSITSATSSSAHTSATSSHQQKRDSTGYNVLELLDKIDKLEAQVLADAAKIKYYESERRSKEAYLTNLTSALKEIGLEMDELVDTNGQKKRATFLQNSSILSTLSDEQVQLIEVDKYRSEVEELKLKIMTIKAHNETLLEEVERARNNSQLANKKCVQLTLDLENANLKTSTLVYKVQELESVVVSQKTELSGLEAKTQGLALKLLDRDNDGNSESATIQSLNANISELETTITSLHNVHHSDVSRIQTLEEQYNTLKSTVSISEQTQSGRLSEMVRELQLVHDRLISAAMEKEELIVELKCSKEEIRKVNEKAMGMNTANGRLTKELSSIKLELKAHEDHMKEEQYKLLRQESVIKRESTELVEAKEIAERTNKKLLIQLHKSYDQCGAIQKELSAARSEGELVVAAAAEARKFNQVLQKQIALLEVEVRESADRVRSDRSDRSDRSSTVSTEVGRYSGGYTSGHVTSASDHYYTDTTSIQRISSELSETKETLRMYRTMNEDLRNMQSEMRSKIGDLESRYHAAMDANTALTLGLGEAKHVAGMKVLESTQILNESEALYGEIAGLKARIAQLRGQNELLCTDLKTVEYDRTALKMMLKDTQNSLDVYINKYQNIIVNNQVNIDNNIDIINKERSSRLDELNISMNRCADSEEKNKILINKNEEIQRQLTQLVSEMHILQAEISTLKEEKVSLIAKNVSNESEIVVFRSEITNLRANLTKFEEEIRVLQSEYNAVKDSLATSEINLETHIDEITILHKNLVESEVKCMALVERTKTQEVEFDHLEADLTISLLMVIEEYTAKSTEFAASVTQTKLLVECIETMEEEQARRKDYLAHFEAQVEENKLSMEESINKLRLKIKEKQMDNNFLNEQLVASSEIFETNIKLNEELIIKEIQINELKKEITLYQGDLQHYVAEHLIEAKKIQKRGTWWPLHHKK